MLTQQGEVGIRIERLVRPPWMYLDGHWPASSSGAM
jgi:hypothetical protein